ncbi:MAG: YceI family protein, partial [Wenzhouxiangellaceae bacterium]|nr:YceI family protein [Wenzhouxiangellaceae bacterium]
MQRTGLVLLMMILLAGPTQVLGASERYIIDTRGAHAFVQFRIPHMGFSWLYGRFNDFSGEFTFNTENPSKSSVEIEIDTASIDTNHERRDEHLRNDDFLSVEEFSIARFESTGFTALGDDRFRLDGDLTLLGQTRPVSIDVKQIGAGQDPWGGYRRGFEGTTVLTLADWGIDYDLGPSATEVEMTLSIEGVRQ